MNKVICLTLLLGVRSVILASNSQIACAGCHPAETKSHQKTRMANAMLPALSSSFGENLPSQPLHESGDGYAFSYTRTADGVSVTAARGADHAEGLIRWIMGAGAQGQTPLVEAGGAKLESRVSYFPQLHQYGITIGQEAGTSASAAAALGAPQNAQAIASCVGCHATGVTAAGEPVTPGIQCERCHPGAAEHTNGHGQPANPGKMSAIQQVSFCGGCHRIKAPVDDAQLENVRFQPLRLTESRCFRSGKLECTTCHVAHQDARRNDPAFYNEKCHACHDAAQTGQPFHADARRTGDCIGCHMPYVQLHPALKFTDHDIRVVKAGDYPAEMFVKR